MSAVALSAGNRPDAGRCVLPAVSDLTVSDPAVSGPAVSACADADAAGPVCAEVRLTRAEYWLLLQAATMRLPLCVAAAPEGPPWGWTIEEALNCCGHGLSRAALARTVQRLVRRGWIGLCRWNICTGQRESLPASRRAIAAEFDRRLDEDVRGIFELTAQGGAVFEAFARPDWERYVEDFSMFGEGDDEPAERRIVAADRRRLMEYLDAVRNECDVVTGSEIVRELADWQPIYWKPPRPGVECRLRCRDKPLQERAMHGTRAQSRRWCEWGG